MLRDISLKNYRMFKDFQIDGLARVNLLVGPNNSGKTTVLEAIYLLMNPDNINDAFYNVLDHRGQILFPEGWINDEHPEPLFQIKPLFYNEILDFELPLYIESKSNDFLAFSLRLYPTIEQTRQLHLNEYATLEIGRGNYNLLVSHTKNKQTVYQANRVNHKGIIPINFRALPPLNSYSLSHLPSILMTSRRLKYDILAEMWDEITLTPKEEKVVKGLQILEPDVERFTLTRGPTAASSILVKLRGRDNPISLGSMGEGMTQILNLIMAAVTSENGVLLVDEIESGLYYDVQADMWRLLIEIAQELNIQIFATTHSWDCVSAFAEALSETKESELGKLFRLDWRGDLIRAIDYPAEQLEKAVDYGIEVR